MQMCDIVTWCDITDFEVGLVTRLFRSSIFCGRVELLFDLLNSQDLLHAPDPILNAETNENA